MTCARKCNPALILDPAKLRNRITIQKNAPRVSDQGGGFSPPNWQDFATVWASVDPLSGREAFQYGETSVPLLRRVRMRYLPGLDTNMRILFRAHTLKIVEALDIEERRQVHQLLTQEDIG